jgi:hypothetical protein
MQGRAFDRVEHGQPNDDLEEWKRTGSWWVAQVERDIFEVACGPLDLSAAVGVVRQWSRHQHSASVTLPQRQDVAPVYDPRDDALQDHAGQKPTMACLLRVRSLPAAKWQSLPMASIPTCAAMPGKVPNRQVHRGASGARGPMPSPQRRSHHPLYRLPGSRRGRVQADDRARVRLPAGRARKGRRRARQPCPIRGDVSVARTARLPRDNQPRRGLARGHELLRSVSYKLLMRRWRAPVMHRRKPQAPTTFCRATCTRAWLSARAAAFDPVRETHAKN